MAIKGTKGPSKGKDGRIIKMATWNIRCGRGAHIHSACRALDSLNIDIGFLQETKITADDNYPRCSQVGGYNIVASNATSKSQGGVAFCWKQKDSFVVEAERKWHANVMSIHVVTGNTRYYIVGCYLPPDDLASLEYVKKAWSQRPSGATPLLIGDFNVDLDSPNNSRADIIGTAG